MEGFSGFWNKVTTAAAEGNILAKAQELAEEGAKLAKDAAQEGAKLAQEQAAIAQQKAAEAGAAATAKAAAIADEIKEKGAGQVFAENTAAAQESLQATMKLALARNEDSVLPPPSLDELMEYGITEEVLEFVRGLTVQTFRDFPAPAEHKPLQMTDWQANHCRLLLRVCDEVLEFRYVLVPRRMTDERFWTVYFTLMANQLEKTLAEAEQAEPAPAATAAAAGVAPPEVSAAILEAVDAPMVSPKPVDDIGLEEISLGSPSKADSAQEMARPAQPEAQEVSTVEAGAAADEKSSSGGAAAAAAAEEEDEEAREGKREGGEGEGPESPSTSMSNSMSGSEAWEKLNLKGADADEADQGGEGAEDNADDDMEAYLKDMLAGGDGDDDDDDDDGSEIDISEFDQLVNSELLDDDGEDDGSLLNANTSDGAGVESASDSPGDQS